MSKHVISVESSSLLHYRLYLYNLSVARDDSWMSSHHMDRLNVCFYHYGS